MSAIEIILGILVILVSLFIIAVVILQQGHRAGINGAISGGADTFLSKNKARTFDATLARLTKWSPRYSSCWRLSLTLLL